MEENNNDDNNNNNNNVNTPATNINTGDHDNFESETKRNHIFTVALVRRPFEHPQAPPGTL